MVYLICAPVFTHLEYITDHKDPNYESDDYYDVRGFPHRSFDYYLLYAKSRSVLVEDSFNFCVNDPKKTMKIFEIVDMTAIVDGEAFIIEEANDETMILDRSVANGYVGQRGTKCYPFALSKIPANELVIKVTGTANYDDGTSKLVQTRIVKAIESEAYVTTIAGHIGDLLRF